MKYVTRSIKYAVKLAVLLTGVFVLMQVSGTSNISSGGGAVDFFAAFFATSRGRIFAAALVVWCAVYPAVEFKKRRLNFDLVLRREEIIKALAAGGMTLAGEDTDPAGNRRMVFRGASLVRRIWWLGDEAVTLTADPAGGFEIEGPRRFVMEAEHRIPNLIKN